MVHDLIRRQLMITSNFHLMPIRIYGAPRGGNTILFFYPDMRRSLPLSTKNNGSRSLLRPDHDFNEGRNLLIRCLRYYG
jgi:hypothetical protein